MRLQFCIFCWPHFSPSLPQTTRTKNVAHQFHPTTRCVPNKANLAILRSCVQKLFIKNCEGCSLSLQGTLSLSLSICFSLQRGILLLLQPLKSIDLGSCFVVDRREMSHCVVHFSHLVVQLVIEHCIELLLRLKTVTVRVLESTVVAKPLL